MSITADSRTRNTMVPDEDLILKYEARIKELEEENAKLKSNQVDINTAKELYLKIFEDFPALIWRSRLDKLCDYFNRTWLEWTGKTMEQEFGNGWTDGVHKDDFDACLETYVKCFDKREAFYMEYRLIDKNGEYRWIGDHGRPFFDLDNTFLGYIGSCYDITDKKNYEKKLLKLNETKDKFFSIVAHDLRNPMSTFVSLSEYLIDNHQDFDEDEMTEIATQMHKDSTSTLLLLENLLDWSKAQSDEAPFKPEPCCISDLCKEVVAQVDLCAKAKKITIKYETNLPGLSAPADKNFIKTVLRNILMNAIKFTHSGGAIDVKTDVLQDEGGCTKSEKEQSELTALVTVSDNGVGMSEQQMADLFDLERSTAVRSRLGTANEGGSGLGLVICKDFIEKHHGKIWAESELGKGTEIKFTVPSASIIDS